MYTEVIFSYYHITGFAEVFSSRLSIWLHSDDVRRLLRRPWHARRDHMGRWCHQNTV